MENCSHPPMHSSLTRLERDTEESKNPAPDRSELQGLRIEIVDGFSMPGFHGRYFMWPEEYWLLSKYADLTDGNYLEIGSMCGIIAMSFAQRYPHRRFVCVDKCSAGSATAAGEKETFTKNLRERGFKNVCLIEGDSLAVAPMLAEPVSERGLRQGAVDVKIGNRKLEIGNGILKINNQQSKIDNCFPFSPSVSTI